MRSVFSLGNRTSFAIPAFVRLLQASNVICSSESIADNQGFLRAGLIQRMIITRIPVLLGSGIPLFGSLPHDVRLEHIATRSYPSSLVQSEYRIAG